jgi:beta-lactamase regulating signal transducer with metallopeptidase domain
MSDTLARLNLFAAGWAEAIGRACWQGGVAIAMVWALCRLIPRLPGRIQCWLWRLAYLKLLVALLWAAPLELPVLAPQALASQTADGGRQAVDGRRQAADPQSQTHPDAVDFAGLPSTACRLPSAELLLHLLWLLGVGWCGAQVLVEWRRTQLLRTRGDAVRDEGLIAECGALCRQFGVRREPVLRTADPLSCPVLVGVVRPAVVLPARFPEQFGPAQLRLMLAHELAHLKRRDLLWAWLPNLGRVLFFFHPLVWLAEREWRLAQEMACDEQVVLSTGASPLRYGALLLEVIGEVQRDFRSSLLTVGVAGSYVTIKRRLVAIRQIRVASPHGSRRHAMVGALAGLMLAVFGIVGVIPWRLTASPARPPRVSVKVGDMASGPEGSMAPRRPRISLLVTIEERRLQGQRLGWRGPLLGPKRFSSRLSRRPRSESPGGLDRSGAGPAEVKVARTIRIEGSLTSGDPLARAVLWLRHSHGKGIETPEEQRRGAKGSLSGTSRFGKDRSGTDRRVMIVADLPPLPVDAGAGSASHSDAFPLPLAAAGLPDAKPSSVFPKGQERADSDLSSRDPERAAFEKRMVGEKRMRASVMLLVPKPVVVPSAFFGWEPSPLFRQPKQMEVRINRPLDPGELKRMLDLACRKGGLDPRDARKMLMEAFQAGGIDPRALKKMLAQAHRQEADDGNLPEEKRMPLLGKKLLFYQEMDQQKREMEKQQGDKGRSVKPFDGIDLDF